MGTEGRSMGTALREKATGLANRLCHRLPSQTKGVEGAEHSPAAIQPQDTG